MQEPLNSEDDVSDEEGQELFDTENVVVCQYDKVRTHIRFTVICLNHRSSLTEAFRQTMAACPCGFYPGHMEEQPVGLTAWLLQLLIFLQLFYAYHIFRS